MKAMKERRRMGHAELVGTVAARVEGRVEGVALKKAIEGLIERDFLERDEREAYVYVE